MGALGREHLENENEKAERVYKESKTKQGILFKLGSLFKNMGDILIEGNRTKCSST